MKKCSAYDPYDIAEKSLARDLHQLKSQLIAAEKECLASLQASSNILRPLIKDVDEFQRNLKVLEQAVSVSKKSPQAFCLSENDVRSRCAFLGDCQQAVLRIEERVRTLLDKANKSALDERTSLFNQNTDAEAEFMRNEAQHQLNMEVEQDWRLREIAKVAERLNETAQTINNELREQTVFLDEFEGEVEDQHGAINQVIKRMGVVLKTNNRRRIKQVLYLIGIFLVLLLLLLI